MRKVTCRITGESGYNYEFYKAPNREVIYITTNHSHHKGETTMKTKILTQKENKLTNEFNKRIIK